MRWLAVTQQRLWRRRRELWRGYDAVKMRQRRMTTPFRKGKMARQREVAVGVKQGRRCGEAAALVDSDG